MPNAFESFDVLTSAAKAAVFTAFFKDVASRGRVEQHESAITSPMCGDFLELMMAHSPPGSPPRVVLHRNQLRRILHSHGVASEFIHVHVRPSLTAAEWALASELCRRSSEPITPTPGGVPSPLPGLLNEAHQLLALREAALAAKQVELNEALARVATLTATLRARDEELAAALTQVTALGAGLQQVVTVAIAASLGAAPAGPRPLAATPQAAAPATPQVAAPATPQAAAAPSPPPAAPAALGAPEAAERRGETAPAAALTPAEVAAAAEADPAPVSADDAAGRLAVVHA